MKQVGCLLEANVQKDMWGQAQGVLHFGDGFSRSHGGQFLWRSLASHLALSGFMSIFDLTQGPPRYMHLLPKMDSSSRVSRLAGHILV